MRPIDGMQRVCATAFRGSGRINVTDFDGSAEDASAGQSS
jgi:hypothetical protein